MYINLNDILNEWWIEVVTVQIWIINYKLKLLFAKIYMK